MMIDQITLVNVLSFLIWKISIVYDMAQRPPGTEKIKTFSNNKTLTINGSNVETYRRFIQDYKAGEIDLNVEKVFQFLIDYLLDTYYSSQLFQVLLFWMA